jgi:hypothetical protein
MGLLNYYINDKIVEIKTELSFYENLELNPDISYFVMYDLYHNKYNKKQEADDWIKYGLVDLKDENIKSVPKNIAFLYKKHGNKVMYKRLMKEFSKQK